MGYDAPCESRSTGRPQGEGSARAEGTGRAGPVAPVDSARERDRGHGGGRLAAASASTARRRRRLALGPGQAEKWAQRITNPPSRLAKLGVKPGMRMLAPRRGRGGVRRRAAAAGATVRAGSARGTDACASTSSSWPSSGARRSTSSGAWSRDRVLTGAIWTLRPKGHARSPRRTRWRRESAAGLVDVKVVSFSDTHDGREVRDPGREATRGRRRRQAIERASERQWSDAIPQGGDHAHDAAAIARRAANGRGLSERGGHERYQRPAAERHRRRGEEIWSARSSPTGCGTST